MANDTSVHCTILATSVYASQDVRVALTGPLVLCLSECTCQSADTAGAPVTSALRGDQPINDDH
jgi:hypothetical protein